jgi:hypothetical protein
MSEAVHDWRRLLGLTPPDCEHVPIVAPAAMLLATREHRPIATWRLTHPAEKTWRVSNNAMTVLVRPYRSGTIVGLSLGSRQYCPPLGSDGLSRAPVHEASVATATRGGDQSELVMEVTHAPGCLESHRMWMEKRGARFHIASTYANAGTSTWSPLVDSLSFVPTLTTALISTLERDDDGAFTATILLADSLTCLRFAWRIHPVDADSLAEPILPPVVSQQTLANGLTIRRVNPPHLTLMPASRVQMDFSISIARCRQTVTASSPTACTHRALACRARGLWVDVTGSWGLFDAGELVLTWLDQHGTSVGSISLGHATPLAMIGLDAEVPLPPAACRLVVELTRDGSREIVDSAIIEAFE